MFSLLKAALFVVLHLVGLLIAIGGFAFAVAALAVSSSLGPLGIFVYFAIGGTSAVGGVALALWSFQEFTYCNW